MLPGEKHHRLTAIGPTDKRERGYILWKFVCDCGVIIEKSTTAVTRGSTHSCGCLGRENAAERMKLLAPKGAAATRTHGHSHPNGGRPTRTFTCWVNMIQRCTNEKHKSFARYGGRGITVCARWLHSFENFLADMGEKPKGLEIDRENNDLGYTPENCRWLGRVANANNRSVNHAIEYDGRTQNIKQWAAEIGTSHNAIAYRLKAGWTVKNALTVPFVRGNNKGN